MKTFSRPFCMVYALTAFFYFHLPPATGHHVIFENIGQMAGALSYLHVKLTLNLSSIVAQQKRYTSLLQELQDLLAVNPPDWNNTAAWAYQEKFKAATELRYNLHRKVAEAHFNDSQEMTENLEALRSRMPDVPAVRSNLVPDLRFTRSTSHGNSTHWNGPKAKVLRGGKFLNFLSLPMGIFGTYMGLYNKAQIDQLRRDLQVTQATQGRLIEVVQEQGHLLKQITSAIHHIAHSFEVLVSNDPALTSTRLSRIEDQIRNRYNIAVHVIQQAQHRRLAIDFLSQEQLRHLYLKIQEHAQENSCALLTQHHSDLFQLELSYFFDGADVHLLLHVPMVPTDSMLRLFKLHPFPLPLSGSHSLIPVSANNILALSSGFKRYSAQLSSTDLMGCHVVNNIYLCERHGVLNTNLNSSCLGSLYQQDFEAVKDLCHLEIHKAGEIVYQLLNNWFLTYSPTSQTVPIDCRNGTQSELHLPKGVTKFNLSPGCRAHLVQHLVLSDISVRLSTDILHFEWQWNELSLDDLRPEVINPSLALFEDSGLIRPTFSDLQQLNLEMKRSPGWWAILVNFTGNLVLFTLFLALIIFLSYRFYLYRRQKKAAAVPTTEPQQE
jgi:hypothetical protein